MLLGKSFRFLVSRLGWCAGGFCIAITGAFCIEIIYGLCDPMDMIAKQMNPSGSSYRPPLDLNMPAPESEEPAPALTDAPETEPASTSNPSQEEMELQRQMEEHVHRRLMATSPQGSNPGLLLQQARETARLKRTIADRMSRLDRDAPDFWRDHRYGFVTEGFLTQNNQVDHSPVYLERLLNELGGQSADATAGERDASRDGLLEMRPFGEAKSISGNQTRQLMRRPYGVKGSVYVVTLPAFQRCLEDGPDAAERDNPGANSPPAGGQETAISRHITTYRQDRRDLGRQPDWESEDP
ncbi:hypothetical protein COLO4_04435 [Corchorus olitorius]|uniref:Uncharacterized protein n=1 Tax=Corchorus olitorius TaxID=93759 RepID=A0A1R3KTU6_9ROSI|nr:hypothetical protein COLO4_04488 [Corchorus olitorius]OMP10519.1 hypothetical protein COLO4_04461 [Corchorus olitorius]OMP10558.1 hypothetical protein COLO4_04435 [Corchorus olitorius]